jgi:Pyridoxamine 5'-phosphate oxidase
MDEEGARMAKTHEQIDDRLTGWIRDQKVFFVATAPMAGDGHVNCSPKGGDSFQVIDPQTVAYQDLTGSGAETIAHLRENGRIVIMFCAFDGPPMIVRLHGRGEVVTPGHPDFASLVAQFPKNSGTRAVIRVKISRVSDSCGYAVPFFKYRGGRDTLDKWAETKGTAGLEEYRKTKNAQSIDGLPELDSDTVPLIKRPGS